MTSQQISEKHPEAFATEKFDIANLQDEIRVEQLCTEFLKIFYLDMVEDQKLAPEDASALAYGADYFIREFIIPDRRENIFKLRPGRVRQFAGHWYITKTLEPNLSELGDILVGVQAFYDYCLKVNKVSAELLADIKKDCAALDYYGERIESFWAIKDDGYQAWTRQCPLED